jgi:hypothetical protein
MLSACYLFNILKAYAFISPSSQHPFNRIVEEQKRYKPTIQKGGCEQMRDFNTFWKTESRREGGDR